VSESLSTTNTLTVRPAEMKQGDKFRYRGAIYRVIEVKQGPYSTYDIFCRRLSSDRVNLDYKDEIEVERP
jgi:hypothetical protein